MQVIPQMFQRFMYYRNHKPKDMVSGYVEYGPPLGYNRRKYWFILKSEMEMISYLFMRRGIIWAEVLHLYTFLRIVQSWASLH